MGYPSDAMNHGWALIKKYFTRTNKRCAASKNDKRTIVNAILYVTRGGIQWRRMPSDFLPSKTVYDHYRN